LSPSESAIALLYDSVLDESLWPAALQALAGAFDAPAATVWHYDRVERRITEFSGHGHDPATIALYAEHYVALDPATPQVLAAQPGEWLGDERLLDARRAHHQAYVHDFAWPHGIGRVGGGQVAADARGCLYLGAQRHPGAPAFGDAGRRTFQAVAPHLARAHALRRRVQGLTAGQGLAQAIVDRLAAGLCVLDARGGVHLANRAAAETLGAGAPLVLQHGVLKAGTAALRDALAAALGAACARDGEPRRASALRHAPAGSPGWTILVTPLPAGHALRDGRDEPLALLLAGPPAAAVPDVGTLRELFGLTPAEAELLAALSAGQTPGEHARRRGVSINTVRTHTAALLSKMGCDSQLALVARARALPALRGRDR
jgi:DNA-binding CsgD family transcriptional regulator/PAS domain-containing protein